MIKSTLNWFDGFVEKCQKYDFLALLSIRLFLIPVIFVGARSKVLGFSGTVAWFGASAADGGLSVSAS